MHSARIDSDGGTANRTTCIYRGHKMCVHFSHDGWQRGGSGGGYRTYSPSSGIRATFPYNTLLVLEHLLVFHSASFGWEKRQLHGPLYPFLIPCAFVQIENANGAAIDSAHSSLTFSCRFSFETANSIGMADRGGVNRFNSLLWNLFSRHQMDL